MRICMDCGTKIDIGDFILICDQCGDELCASCEPYHEWRAQINIDRSKDKILCSVCFAEMDNNG